MCTYMRTCWFICVNHRLYEPDLPPPPMTMFRVSHCPMWVVGPATPAPSVGGNGRLWAGGHAPAVNKLKNEFQSTYVKEVSQPE